MCVAHACESPVAHACLPCPGLQEFADLWPDKFQNKTNGVTPRRWLAFCNPPLRALISATLGSDDWIADLDLLQVGFEEPCPMSVNFNGSLSPGRFVHCLGPQVPGPFTRALLGKLACHNIAIACS